MNVHPRLMETAITRKLVMLLCDQVQLAEGHDAASHVVH